MKGRIQLCPVGIFIAFFLLCHTDISAQCSIQNQTPNHVCIPSLSEFRFVNKTGMIIKKVFWDFGDGNTETDSVLSAKHLYVKPGQYSPKAIATFIDNSTCAGTAVQEMMVFDHPNASLYPSSLKECFLINGFVNLFGFFDASIPGASQAPIQKYAWNFGDGSSSQNKNPTHTYLVPGSYQASLIVTDTNGCSNLAIASQPVVVLKNIYPKIILDINTGCNSVPVQFKNITDTSDINVQSVSWDFGDGSATSTSYSPNHNYGPGSFVFSIRMTNNLGCSFDSQAVINVGKFGIRTFFDDTICWADAHKAGVPFSADQQPNVTFWQWNFDDPASGANNISNFHWTAYHKFAGGPGNYHVKFKMINANKNCGELDTCFVVHIKGPMAMINLPAPQFQPNKYYTARPMPKSVFSAINNNPASCSTQTITYSIFNKTGDIRHVKYLYCNAPVLTETHDTAVDCYDGHKMPFVSSITLKPTDSTVSIIKDSIESRIVWNKGDKIPTGNVYYPSYGTLNTNNMHDSNLATCQLPNLVHFTNNSIKYRLQKQLDDNTFLNVTDPAHSLQDNCLWKNYPMASDSLVYFWKFNDPSGAACTSSVTNKNWDCNFSTLAAPYHNYTGKKGFPAGGSQPVMLTVLDTIMHCADSTILILKQGPANAYWDRSAYCKMNWDMQASGLAPSGKGFPNALPRTGFMLDNQSNACTGASYPFKIDFSQTLPQTGASHWWIIFDSANVVKYKKCSNGTDSTLNFGFGGDPVKGYSPGRNGYPAAGPDTYWLGAPWLGKYWYEQGDRGCKTIGIVLQNGTCYDTAWYHDYICFNPIDAGFSVYNVLPTVPTATDKGKEYLVGDSKSSSVGHICQSGFGESVRVRFYPVPTNQKDITSFSYRTQRRTLYTPPTQDNSGWYYSMPFWPDSATFSPFTTDDETVQSIDHHLYEIDTPNVYIIQNLPGLPTHKAIANFPFYKNEMDSLTARNHVNIPASDPRYRLISGTCGKPFTTIYASKTSANTAIPVLNLSGVAAVDSLVLPYPGFYTIKSSATNLQGCLQTSTYNLIYGHFATFNAKNDSVICLGQPAHFDYYVRYWGTHCMPDPASGTVPPGCLNGSDEVAGLSNNIDFKPWDHADPTAYRDSLTSGNFSKNPPVTYQPEQMYWDFGDKTGFIKFVTGAKISHTYTKPGVYNVTMRTIDWRGCAVSTLRKNLIKVMQVAPDFTLQNLTDTALTCTPKSVVFLNKTAFYGNRFTEKVIKNGLIIDSTFMVDTISGFYWSPGDGRTIQVPTSADFTTVYNKLDSYTVSLKVVTDHGCTATKTKIKYIKASDRPVNAHWTVKTDKSGNASFTNDDLKNNRYGWNFGTGAFSDKLSPVYLYPKSGEYLVQGYAANQSGCVAEFDSSIILDFHNSGIAYNKAFHDSFSIYPNPFSSATTLAYIIVKADRVRIMLYDLTAKEIGKLIDQYQTTGAYQLSLSAKELHLKPGIYLVTFQAEENYMTRKMIITE